MILKISKNHLYTHAGWRIFSGIANISYTSVMSGITTNEELVEAIQQIEEMDKPSCRPKYFPPTNKTGNWIQISVLFEDERKEEWIVQAETYLLNDEGKTIERIYP